MWNMLKKPCCALLLLTVSPLLSARAIVDVDVLQTFKHSKTTKLTPLSLLVFLHNGSEKESFIDEVKKFPMCTFRI